MSRRLTVVAGDDERVAALNAATASDLGAGGGAAVELSGTRRAVALVRVVDVDGDAVGLASATRENAGVDVGDRVTVAPVDAPPADRVTLAPRHDLRLQGGGDAFSKRLDGLPVLVDERVRLSLFGGALDLPFVVVSTDPAGPVTVTSTTEVVVRDAGAADRSGPPLRNVRLEDVGGLRREREALSDLVGVLDADDVFERLGRRPATGVLVGGPAGVGKTRLVHALVNETGATFVPVDTIRLSELRGDEADDRLADAAERARREAPSLVHVPDLNVVVPEDGSETQRRLVGRLGRFLDDLVEAPGVVVVGEADAIGDVARALRRGGRFDRELEFHVPTRDERRELFDVHVRGLELAGDVDLDELAARTHGFVGADVASVCRAATSAAARRIERARAADGGNDAGAVVDDAAVTVGMADFADALDEVEPSAMRDVAIEVPEVTWDDIGGLEGPKRELIRSVEWPLTHPELFADAGISPPQGILLYGPPGTGKTMLARAVANATDANFISVKGPELLNKYVGESERAVRETFERARQNAPTVIFFDEIDAISSERSDDDSGAPERVVSQLLTELDGIERLESVTAIGATNRPDRIDRALLRPGRFERLVAVPIPDRAAREAIFRVHTRSMPLDGVDLAGLADRTEGFTGSDIEAVVREAGMAAIEDAITRDGGRVAVTASQLEAAIADATPSTTAEQRDYYERLAERGVR